MGLFDWLRRLFLGGQAEPARAPSHDRGSAPSRRRRTRRRKVKLVPLRYAARKQKPPAAALPRAPYRFSRPSVRGGWLDLARDEDAARLQRLNLPRFQTPEELAKWLEMPLGQLAWLIHRFDEEQRAADQRASHYFYRWIKKRSFGRRLIEAPKSKLKRVQWRILEQILSRVPCHPAAHGFLAGRSIVTNAQPHVGQRVLLKLDLEQFYPSVSFNRVVAIFRSLGYSREAAIWLGRLTTTTLPADLLRDGHPDLAPYLGRRLPQGSPTSPALANLSAFPLDLRLAGLARSFGAQYSRYADDLTFSGDEKFLRSLAVFIPLAQKIIRSERFRVNKTKRKVIRNNQRQVVTGVVVNSRPNLSRREYDRLKAILTNCVRRGPSTQNHDRHENFAAHLLGKIAHVAQLNPARAAKLRALFLQIDWNR